VIELEIKKIKKSNLTIQKLIRSIGFYYQARYENIATAFQKGYHTQNPLPDEQFSLLDQYLLPFKLPVS
jgi:hypothetical protein